ncbi:MAG: hypothetical protein IKE58_07405 [Blautia sp.]|nr:hypothetical protein [Blautia sp.]
MLNKKCLLAAFAAAICLAIPASAASFTTPDGVLTIQLPSDSWYEVQDMTRWVVLSDGTNTINIDHYSNGADIPAMPVANSQYANVIYDAFSTRNEVFILTGLVVDPSNTANIRNAIRSAQILIYDTKKAVTGSQAASAPAPAAKTENAAPAANNTQTAPSTGANTDKVQCEYCGEWLETGNIFRNHMCPQKEAALAQESINGDEQVQCEYCGAWLHSGNEYRNHMCPQKEAALAQENAGGDEQVQCEYCGAWLHAGNEYRNHMCPQKEAALSQESGTEDYVDDTKESQEEYVDDTQQEYVDDSQDYVDDSQEYVDDSQGYVDDTDDMEAYIEG